MIARLFRSNQPAVLLAVPVLVVALFARAAAAPHAPAAGVMPLYRLVETMLAGIAWGPGALGMLLVVAIAAQLTVLVNGTELMERRTHLPALLFPLLLAAFGPSDPFGPALMGMPLVIMALHRVLSITNIGQVLGRLFDAGLLLGIAALFFLPYVLLLVVVWAAVSMIRPFHWREYIVPLVGCALPFYLAWAVHFLLGGMSWDPLATVLPAGTLDEPVSPDTMAKVSAAQRTLFHLVAGLLGLASAKTFLNGYRRAVVREKKLRSAFIVFMLVLAATGGMVHTLRGTFPPVLAAVPLAVFLAYGLLGTRRPWLGESAVYSLLLLALWARWGG